VTDLADLLRNSLGERIAMQLRVTDDRGTPGSIPDSSKTPSSTSRSMPAMPCRRAAR